MTPTGAIRAVWTLVLIAVVFAVLLALSIGYTNHVQHQSDQQNRMALQKSEQVWCGILLLILHTPTVPNPVQLEFRTQMAILARSYGCSGVPESPPLVSPSPAAGKRSPATTGAARDDQGGLERRYPAAGR